MDSYIKYIVYNGRVFELYPDDVVDVPNHWIDTLKKGTHFRYTTDRSDIIRILAYDTEVVDLSIVHSMDDQCHLSLFDQPNNGNLPYVSMIHDKWVSLDGDLVDGTDDILSMMLEDVDGNSYLQMKVDDPLLPRAREYAQEYRVNLSIV